MKWADLFCTKAIASGLKCAVVNRANGWPETVAVNKRICFTKSMTYNQQRNLYFQGVDPKKLENMGDYVLLCGGADDELRDIFLIPWDAFFGALKEGLPLNTYKPPRREYWQYKFNLRDRMGKWYMSVQRSQQPDLDVTQWRYDIRMAIDLLR